MVNAVNSGTASVNVALTGAGKTEQAVQTVSADQQTQGTLEDDSVVISDAAKAAALGDPNWPKPPEKEQN